MCFSKSWSSDTVLVVDLRRRFGILTDFSIDGGVGGDRSGVTVGGDGLGCFRVLLSCFGILLDFNCRGIVSLGMTAFEFGDDAVGDLKVIAVSAAIEDQGGDSFGSVLLIRLTTGSPSAHFTADR